MVRPLGALAAGLTRLQGSLYQPPDTQIPGIMDTDWPTPLQPIRPFGQPGQPPIVMNMMMGQNLIFTPRPDSRYSAADLQALARYPLARICITNVIDTISTLRWKIQLRAQPGEDQKAREERTLKDDTILELTSFVSHPDNEHDWSEWVRPLLNDMMTIDAGAVFLRRDKENKVYEWRVMQGAYVVRLVDRMGCTPEAPYPAYQLLWDGMPLWNLSTDQLLYRPRNIVYQVGNVASNLYGMSPTEQLAPEIEVGMQRLRYVTAFYKDGAVPNVLWVVPSDTQPDVVDNAMKIINQDMAGNLESRRQFRFAQGFRSSDSPKEDQIKQFDEPRLADEYDDLHTRRICFGYGTSAQRLIRMMTRSTAQSNQEAAEEEGIAPFRKWVQDYMNCLLQRKMGYEKYEFVFDVSQVSDPEKQAALDKVLFDGGPQTLNETRIARGLDPRAEAQADQLGKWLPTGWAPMDASLAISPPDGSAGPHLGYLAEQNANAQDADHGGGNPKEPPEPNPSKKKIAKSDAPAQFQAAPDSVRARTAESALFSRLIRFFHQTANSMVIVDARSGKTQKADEDEPTLEDQVEQIVAQIMAAIPWKLLPNDVMPAIQEAALEGAQHGLEQAERAYQASAEEVLISPAPIRVIVQGVIAEVNQVAVDYAKDRAAEMVGMKWVDGELVTNPNAEMAISEATRDMLRRTITEALSGGVPFSELTDRIRIAGAFSEDRAKLIADTEIKFAQSHGNLQAWLRTGVVKKVKWSVSSLHRELDECDDNREVGPIDVGKVFPSGVLAPPAHPNCNCTLAVTELNPPPKLK